MNLTPRELDVIRLYILGHSNRMIAHYLGISVIFVADSISSIFVKLAAHDRESVVNAWQRESEVGQ